MDDECARSDIPFPLKMRRAISLCSVVAAVLATACNNLTDISCTDNSARVKVSPTSRTMIVGEQFKPTVTAAVCGGTQPTPFIGRFSSANRVVARVDSIGGTITGVSIGETYVFARYAIDGAPVGGLRDSIRVMVQ